MIRGQRVNLDGLCSLKWNFMLLAVLETLPNNANIIPELHNVIIT